MKAKCIRGSTGYLTVGKIYEVEENIHDPSRLYSVVDDRGSFEWEKDRFEIVQEKMGKIFAECIDNSAATAFLTVGKTYEVTEHPSNPTRFILAKDDSGETSDTDCGWMKSRFKVVSSLPTASSNASDLDDWRKWANNRPGECACGILKSLCNYHNV
jgi:hypothetical protein